MRSTLRQRNRPERPPQREVIGDLEHPAEHQRRESQPAANSAPPSVGLSAAARLRGTAVKLAAAGRSGGVTTAIT